MRCHWSKRHRRVEARQQERFGALVLDDRIWRDVPTEAVQAALMEGLRDLWAGRAELDESRASAQGARWRSRAK